MISPEIASIDSLVLHKVGNKAIDEGVMLSKSPMKTNEAIDQLLLTYFFSPFKNKEYYNFFHDTSLELHEMYKYSSAIFKNPDCLYEQSINITKHLYNNSNHPKIKSGEVYVVYFQDCILDDQTVDAIGVFKSESKETYLKVNSTGEGYQINSENGINIKKLDKGCLIFNTEEENGYIVTQVDNLSKQSEARYWHEDFLQIKQCNDAYFQTQNTLEMCKDFVAERLSEEFDVSMLDRSDLLNKSAKFFKEKDEFSMDEFAEEVIQQPEVLNAFNNYKEQYISEKDMPLVDHFAISNEAVKKQARFFKSVIKLDKNFHVYVHGNRENIVSGYDESKGMHFYQLFFNEES
jgi:Uri superfamily endonuclease